MDERERKAAAFAIGALDPDEYTALVDAAAHDPALRALIAQWDARLAPLAEAPPAIAPPDSAFETILSRIDNTALPPPGTRTVRARDGGWQTTAPGFESKRLNRDEETGRETTLLRIAPGATYSGHAHQAHEELFILSGDLCFGEFELGAGDYHCVPPGGNHPDSITRTGCMALLLTGPH